MLPSDLPVRWRAQAEELRANALETPARIYERAAADLEAAWSEFMGGILSLDEAVLESGYSPGHIRRLIREGTVPNVGSEREPRVCRRNLPRKPGYGVATLAVQDAPSTGQIARAVASGER